MSKPYQKHMMSHRLDLCQGWEYSKWEVQSSASHLRMHTGTALDVS